MLARIKAPNDNEIARGFEGCIATATRTLDRVIMQTYDEALRPLGIKSTQLTLLVYIGANRTPSGGATASELVPQMHIDQTTLSRNIDRLIATGLVRADEDADARAKRLSLTPRGRALMKKALPIWRDCQARIADAVGSAFPKAAIAAAAKLTG